MCLAQVYVDHKYFPDFKKVEPLLQSFIHSVNDKLKTVKGIEVLKLAADVHYNFVNIHPLGDGNGRTARLLMNYIQMFHKEPLIKIFTEDRAEYIDALNQTEANSDLSIFRTFIAQQQIKFYENEIGKFNRRNSGFNLLF